LTRAARRARLRLASSVLAVLLLLPGCAWLRPAPWVLHADRALLWTVRGPAGSPGTVYLLGSVHVRGDRPLALDAALEQAFQRSDELWVEVNLLAVEPGELAQAALERARLQPPQRLHDLVSPDTEALLQAFAAAHHLDLERLEGLKPWAVALALSTFQMQAQGLKPTQGVDLYFMERAHGQKPIGSLESVASQFAVLDSLPPSMQETMLRGALEDDEKPSGATPLEPIVDSWEAGDEAALSATLFAPLQEHPELAPFYEQVYFARNSAMSARLERFLSEPRTRFVVVGAGHLLGPRGIVAELRQAGCRVERGAAGAR
jgi:uncharacterized protein YbaP (TraB family)